MRIHPACLLALFLTVCAPHARAETARPWKLLHRETFKSLPDARTLPWFHDAMDKDSKDVFGDNGKFFQVIGGRDFKKQVQSFRIMRKRIWFGEDDWLTLELACRAPLGGGPEAPPSFTSMRLKDGRSAGHIIVPSHDGALLIRSSRPLPVRYRVEYTVLETHFGGTRGGQWTYEKRVNGYDTSRKKTNHPWVWGPGEVFDKPADQWADATVANGFYFLTIVDHADPEPHNNVFIHTHRKVGLDSYHVMDVSADPRAHQNAINAIFFSTGTMIESQAIGTPVAEPKGSFVVAIERDENGYTLEVAGRRLTRKFIEGGRPIWHFNQTETEYDGRFDTVEAYRGPHGTVTIDHTWPPESSYPDTFIIGDPHLNYYEGEAVISDLRLYTR